MKQATRCIVCGGTRLTGMPTWVAPFLRTYVWHTSTDIDCRFLTCEDCTVCFYDLRPDADEMERLYSGYRGENYVAERARHEPEYRRVNQGLGSDREVDVRRENLEQILRNVRGTRPLSRVLDYGGDAGQFIPRSLEESRRFVYEVSGVAPLEGVIAIADPASAAPYDFIMCCHLLEHVAEPFALTRELARLAAPEGLIYFEVPWEPHFFRRVLRRIGRKGWTPPPLHEHITFFTRQALRTLITRAGMSVLACSIHRIDLDGTDLRVISMFAAPGGADPGSPGKSRFVALAAEFGRWFFMEARKHVHSLLRSPGGPEGSIQ